MRYTTTLNPNESAAIDTFYTTSTAGSLSNVLQIGFHYGADNRTVIVWDLTGLEDSAVVGSATLTLNHSSDTIGSAATIKVYRITEEDVTESATWTTYDGTNAWATAGGDYTEDGALTFAFTPGDNLVLSGSALVRMINDALQNRDKYLRILIGTEESMSGTASGSERIKFHSSGTSSSTGDRPTLVIDYDKVVHWVGGSGDSLDTAANWSTGSIPAAGDRVLFASGEDSITRGTLTCDIACIGEKFAGALGLTSGTAVDIDADTIVFGSRRAEINVDIVGGPDVFIADSPSSAGLFKLNGGPANLLVSKTRAKHEVDGNIGVVVIAPNLGRSELEFGDTFGGDIHLRNANAKCSDVCRHAKVGWRSTLETGGSGDTGRIFVGDEGRVRFGSGGISNTNGNSIVALGTFACDTSTQEADIGGKIETIGGTMDLRSSTGVVKFETDALQLFDATIRLPADVKITED